MTKLGSLICLIFCWYRYRLMFSTLGKYFSKQFLNIFLIFSQKIGFDISCRLSMTICMKCQSLFSGKNKKNIINLLSAEFANSMVKIKGFLL